MLSNPFQPLKDKPKSTETNYHTDEDKFIITYGEVDKVKITGDKDTDFIINKEVVEMDRVNRQEYYDSMSNDVGILNIIEKVRLSGDITLLNQTGRTSIPGNDVDALGRKVEDVVDVTKYQVDQIDALESYKVGSAAFDSLDPELKKKMSLKQVAEMSDEEIDSFLKSRKEKLAAKVETAKGDE